MDVRKVLEELIEKDGLDNISLNDNTFTVYFGDVLNTETDTGNTYYLLDTYIEFPYTLNPSMVKLHRGIVNEFETGGPDYQYEYSGFVHYGSGFCWGQCRVDAILQNAILEDAFTDDTYYSLILHFQNYLETSSHDSGSRTTMYKKLDLQDVITEIYNVPVSVRNIDGIPYIFEFSEITKIKNNSAIDYSKPYKKVLKNFNNKAFVYKGNTIIPKVVDHYTIETTEIKVTPKFQNLETILFTINNEKFNLIENEINNKKRITFQDCIHQLTNS
jgi:hypothetical protein